MRIFLTITAAFAVTLLVVAVGSAWSADPKSIQGKLTGADGKGYAGAEIRVERIDAKAKPIVTETDAKGVYVFRGLPVGTYQVIACVNGKDRSRARVQTSSAGWTKVDFDLRLNEKRGDGVDHMQTDLSLHTPAPGR